MSGPATGVSVTAALSCCDVELYREGYYEATRQSDGEGGTGRWGDILIPETDIVYGQNRNAFPFDVPAGENRVVWVDVYVPTTAATGTTNGTFTVTSAGGTTVVPLSLRIMDVTLPSTSTLPNVFAMPPMDGGGNPVCFAHTGSDTCHGNQGTASTLSSLYTRMALEIRVTIPNGCGFGGTNDTPAQWGPTWETAFEAPIITGTSSYPASAGWHLAGARLTRVLADADRDYHCLTACASAWASEANEPAAPFADRVLWYGCDEANTTQVEHLQGAPRPGQRRVVRPALAQTNWANWTTGGGQATGCRPARWCRTSCRCSRRRAPAPAASRPWLAGDPQRQLWLATACQASGCDGDVDPDSNQPLWDGWPSYQIDAPANQARAMAWMSERFDARGELDWSTAHRLATAFDAGGSSTTVPTATARSSTPARSQAPTASAARTTSRSSRCGSSGCETGARTTS